jgi:CDP-ribitol ribitolphosphotransferase
MGARGILAAPAVFFRRAARALQARLLRLIESLLPVDPRRIRLITQMNSGSNTAALFELAPESIKERYDLRLVRPPSSDSFAARLRHLLDVGRARLLVTTHGRRKANPRQRHVELWHGFPLKSMGLMDRTDVAAGRARPRAWKGVDLVASYSQLYSTLINACMGLDVEKYAVTGLPRNDLLFREDGLAGLDGLLGKVTGDRKIVFFMPTFREGFRSRVDGAKRSDNVFGFPLFDPERFARYLEAERIRFVAKLHPFEERVFARKEARLEEAGIELLTELSLREASVELYGILSCCDALVTDYSSVYFDLLLRDRPCVFTPVDLDEYRASRGMLLEPYDFWTPGPKALDQESLEAELARSLRDPGYFSAERAIVKRLIHAHDDGRSSARVWDAIEELL